MPVVTYWLSMQLYGEDNGCRCALVEPVDGISRQFVWKLPLQKPSTFLLCTGNILTCLLLALNYSENLLCNRRFQRSQTWHILSTKWKLVILVAIPPSYSTYPLSVIMVRNIYCWPHAQPPTWRAMVLSLVTKPTFLWVSLGWSIRMLHYASIAGRRIFSTTFRL